MCFPGIEATPLEQELVSWKRSYKNNFKQTITHEVPVQCVQYDCWMYYQDQCTGYQLLCLLMRLIVGQGVSLCH